MLDGYKTWIGIAITVLGWLGWGDLINAGQLTDIFNLTTQLVGILVTVYGNYRAHQTIATLGATSHCKTCSNLI